MMVVAVTPTEEERGERVVDELPVIAHFCVALIGSESSNTNKRQALLASPHRKETGIRGETTCSKSHSEVAGCGETLSLSASKVPTVQLPHSKC